jgi:hypothetical protein
VPRTKLACGRVGDDGDGMAAQPGINALTLLSRPAACAGCQLVRLHGIGNWSPTRRSGGARAPDSRRMSGQRLVARGGELSCRAETCRARRKVVVRDGDLSEGSL